MPHNKDTGTVYDFQICRYSNCNRFLGISNQEHGGTKSPQKCVFPFKFRGHEYNACTTVADPDDKPWCAVEVDEKGNSEWKKWGHCHPSCSTYDNPEMTTKKPNSMTIDEDGLSYKFGQPLMNIREDITCSTHTVVDIIERLNAHTDTSGWSTCHVKMPCLRVSSCQTQYKCTMMKISFSEIPY